MQEWSCYILWCCDWIFFFPSKNSVNLLFHLLKNWFLLNLCLAPTLSGSEKINLPGELIAANELIYLGLKPVLVLGRSIFYLLFKKYQPMTLHFAFSFCVLFFLLTITYCFIIYNLLILFLSTLPSFPFCLLRCKLCKCRVFASLFVHCVLPKLKMMPGT